MRILLGLGALTLFLGAPATAAIHAGHPGFPVIGCDDARYPYANHYGRNYAPRGFCATRRGAGVRGIDHTRWQGWGRSRATGRGYLVVYTDAVAEYPAQITAYGFWATNHFAGSNEYLSAYTYLHVHVLARRAPQTAGVELWRGPLDLTLNVQIEQ
jgi:hypothetical protein